VATGQRPKHGRAGAGLASPAGTGAGADVIISRRGCIRVRATLIRMRLTFHLVKKTLRIMLMMRFCFIIKGFM
jgi:hypothetical protein